MKICYKREKVRRMRIPGQRASFLIIALVLYFALFEGAISEMKTQTINLPKTTGSWTRPNSPQIINSQNIFDYMDGAGELYIGYRFDHLEVYEYKSASQDDILVELYWMQTSDDAFGLLSLDWGGEPLSLSKGGESETNDSVSLSIRALYGEGLLRIWSDNLYARVMSYRETPESREAVLFLGKVITSSRKNLPEPYLLKALCPRLGSEWILQRDSVSFFRSYLVLNSIYYVSPQNILNLDHSADAVTASYENSTQSGHTQRPRFLLIKYESSSKANTALAHFHDAFLPEQERKKEADSSPKKPGVFKIEDGWLGYQLTGRYLAVVFDCPDRKSAEMIIHQNVFNLLKLED